METSIFPCKSPYILVNPMGIPMTLPCTRRLHGWASAYSARQWCGAACGTPQWWQWWCHRGISWGISWGISCGFHTGYLSADFGIFMEIGQKQGAIRLVFETNLPLKPVSCICSLQIWQMVSWTNLKWSVEASKIIRWAFQFASKIMSWNGSENICWAWSW